MIPRRFRNGSSIALLALNRYNRPFYRPPIQANWIQLCSQNPRSLPKNFRPDHRCIADIAISKRDSTTAQSNKTSSKQQSLQSKQQVNNRPASFALPTNLDSVLQGQVALDIKTRKQQIAHEKDEMFRQTQSAEQAVLCEQVQLLLQSHKYEDAVRLLLTSAANGVQVPFSLCRPVYERASTLHIDTIIDLLQTTLPVMETKSSYSKISPIWKAYQQFVGRLDYNQARSAFLRSKYTQHDIEVMVRTHLIRRLITATGPHVMDVQQIIQDIRETVNLPAQQQSLCNLVLTQYLRTRDPNGAPIILELMQKHHIMPTNVTFNIILHNELFVRNNLSTATALYKRIIQDDIPISAALCNSFLKYHLQHQNWDEAEEWLDISLGAKNNAGFNWYTSSILADALANNPNSSGIASIAEKMLSHPSFISNMHDDAVYNSYLAFLLRHDRISIARFLIQQYSPRLSQPLSVCTCNLHLRAITLSGDLTDARAMLEKMIHGLDDLPHPDIISFATVIDGYLLRNPEGTPDVNGANELVKEMAQHGVGLNEVVHGIILQGLLKSDFSDIKPARKLFNTIIDSQPEGTANEYTNTILYNTMMNGYFIHHRLMNTNNIPGEVYQLLKQGRKRRVKFNTSTLNIWVRGLAKMNGDMIAAESMFRQFTRMGVAANERTIWYIVDTAVKKHRWQDAKRWLDYAQSNGIPLEGAGMQKHIQLIDDYLHKKSKSAFSDSDIDSID
ncbi:hypothetical protein NQZ79_g2201 [Umbelopsis isabellina]|nr:hypothetical protein NQZ79_g2201 [Umbelopsis isabellina]